MNTTLVGRLFWKEYRFQRGLWLGIIAILLVIQFTIWGVMPPNQHNPLATLASIGVLLSAFYALGSAAVMFAGEREEGTDTWLRILPVTSLPVCGGKIAWMICSWAAAMAVGLLAAWLLTLRNPGEITLNRQTLVAALTYGGLMPLWGILFSLVCRRVYIAIALAAGALVLTVFVNSYAPGFNYFALAALAVADVSLGRRWLLTDGDFAFDRIGRTVRGFTLDDALATSVEPSLWWRFYRRELWLECRQARWLVLGQAVFAVALLSFVTIMNIPEVKQICWLVVFGMLPLQYGVSVFLGEQFRERFRFQTNQGVTPSALWCAKQTVWIGLTLLSIGLLFMFWLPKMMNSGRSSAQFYHLHQSLPIPEGFLPTFIYEGMLASPWPFVGITLGIAGLMYSVGQLCSVLFHRSVTSGGIAFLGGAVLCGWLLTAVILNVPLTISVLFPCLAMLGLSLWRTNGWLTERNTVRDGLKIAGIAAMLMFLSYQSWVIWRMLEVDAPRPLAELTALFPAVSALVYGVAVGFALSPPGMLLLLVCLAAGWWKWGRSVRKRLTLRRVLVTYAALLLLATGGTAWVLHAEWQNFSQQLNAEIVTLRPSQEALATGDLYRRAEELLTAKFPIPERGEDEPKIQWNKYYFASWDQTTDSQKQWLSDNEESLSVLLDATARSECAPDDYFRESSGGDVKLIPFVWTGARNLLRLKALEAEERGDLADAWKYLRASVRMMVHHTPYTHSWGRNLAINQFSTDLFSFDLLRWLKHGDQTSELLERAASDLIAEYRQMPSLRANLELEATHAMWMLDGNRLESWVGGGGLSLENIQSGLMQFLHATPGERTRARLLLANVSRHQLEMADAVQNGAAHTYAPELLTLHHFRFMTEGRYPAWEGWRHYKGRYDALWNKSETTPLWECDQIWPPVPHRDAYLWLQELEFIAARRTIFLQLAAEWTRLKTGKLLGNVRELIEESAGQSLTDSNENLVTIYEKAVAAHPILKWAEEYEMSLISSDFKVTEGSRVLIDPVTNRPFELDFTNDIDRKTPEQ